MSCQNCARKCSQCCQDFDIKVMHLILPHEMSDDGQEFVRVHGIPDLIKTNGPLTFEWNGTRFTLPILGIFFPDLYLDQAGLDIFIGFDLDKLVTTNATIKVFHVCDKLDISKNHCTIYAERPNICKDFDCSTRNDCLQDT